MPTLMGSTNGDSFNSIRYPTGNFKFYEKTFANNSTWLSSPKQTCWDSLILTIVYSWSNNTCKLLLLLLMLLLSDYYNFLTTQPQMTFTTWCLRSTMLPTPWTATKRSAHTVPAWCCNLAPPPLSARCIVQVVKRGSPYFALICRKWRLSFVMVNKLARYILL